ncbi:hypothetical protein VP01_1304g4 [Puccinia sorghi]|uniref:Uncharacterized protein n=1 Tax=Puccinia sorghi TaxID=27349 RepID=A0A0L6VN30_9BASI|nr:hypothetical protein VP01_1304g4 [Puccinia sorghi]
MAPQLQSGQHRTIDHSDLVESIQEPDDFPEVRPGRISLSNSSVTHHCCSGSDESTATESEASVPLLQVMPHKFLVFFFLLFLFFSRTLTFLIPVVITLIQPLQHTLKSLVDQRSTSIKRFLRDEAAFRSADGDSQPVVIRNSIDSKSTAVDSISSCRCSPNPPHTYRLEHRSFSPLSAHHHPIYSQPPSWPPPTCPLPAIPSIPNPSASLPHPESHSPARAASSAGSYFYPNAKSYPAVYPSASHPNLLQLKSQVSLHHIHPSTSYRQALQPLDDSLYDEDPFAAERIVVTGTPHMISSSRWSDESVDPLGPAPRSASSHSVYTTASESCYSVNTTINSRVVPSSLGGYVYGGTPTLQRPPTSVTTTAESQEGLITLTNSAEDENLRQIGLPQLHRLAMTSPKPPHPPKKDVTSFNSSRLPLSETFSFGLPSRFDGFFFGYHRRPDQKYHAGPAMILKVSPPISSTVFSPNQSIHFKISLAHLFDHVLVSFVGESRLLGHQKIQSHRFLKHEIDLHSPGKWGCWEVQRGTDPKEWLVHLKIPSVSNCSCSKEQLDQKYFRERELPSSTINNQVGDLINLIMMMDLACADPFSLVRSLLLIISLYAGLGNRRRATRRQKRRKNLKVKRGSD